jgi:hypothetical protein
MAARLIAQGLVCLGLHCIALHCIACLLAWTTLTVWIAWQLFEMVEEPFSVEFCNEVLQIINSPLSIHALRAPESRNHVIHFLGMS